MFPMPSYRLAALVIGITVIMGTPLPAAAISKADLQIKHNQDIRKARNDSKKQVEIHLAYLAIVVPMARDEKDIQKFIGFESLFGEVKEAMAQFKDQKGGGDPEVVRLEGEVAAMKATILEAFATVKGGIINAAAPQDLYRGSDKATLLASVKQAWATNYPTEEIVAIRFDHPEWVRKQTKEWIESGHYYRNLDISVLEVQVIVKKDEAMGTVFPVFIQKDNSNPGAGAVAGRKLIAEGSRPIPLKLVK